MCDTDIVSTFTNGESLARLTKNINLLTLPALSLVMKMGLPNRQNYIPHLAAGNMVKHTTNRINRCSDF